MKKSHVKEAYDDYMSLSNSNQNNTNNKSFVNNHKKTIGWITILISIFALCISIISNQISKKQAEYEMNKENEYFKIDTNFSSHDDALLVDYTIMNTGGSIKDCAILVDYAIKLSLNGKTKYIHVGGTSSSSLPFNFSNPLTNKNNWIDVFMNNYIHEMNYDDMSGYTEIYIKIGYIDRLENEKTKYYCINGFLTYEMEYYSINQYDDNLSYSKIYEEDFIDDLKQKITEFYYEFK